MKIDRARIVGVGASTGFRGETIEKVERLVELIDDVSRHPVLAEVLLLKGGTALNLGFGEPTRLSVDLDFNYVGSPDRGTMVAQRPEVEQALENIARAQGYKVQHSSAEHAGHKFFLGYRNVFGSNDRVEVDLNFLHRVPMVPAMQLNLWRPGGERGSVVRAVGIEELCAGKMCALLDRVLPRDCYDVVRLPAIAADRWDQRLRRLFIALAGTLDRPLVEYGAERLEKLTDQAISSELHPMLRPGDLPSADQLKRATWEVISPLLNLTPEEREYTDRIQAGELKPELLFPDDSGQADVLRTHPALLWKAENAKSHRRKAATSAASRPRKRR